MSGKSLLLITIILISSVLLLFSLMPKTIKIGIAASISADPLIIPERLKLTLPSQKTKKVSKEINKVSAPSKTESADNNYILTCQTPLNYEHAYAEQKLKPFHDYLSKSNMPEHLLASIIFTPETQQASKLELLHDYLQEYPDNKLALMDLIGYCSDKVEHSVCSTTLFDRAKAVDGQNGALWLQIANFHAASGNEQATLDSIHNANKASQFNDYYYQHLALFMSVSKGTLDITDNLRGIAGIGYHAAIAIRIRHLTKFCTATNNVFNNKNHECLALGEILEKRGRNRVVNAVGLAIQERIYQSESNNELLTKAKTRKAAFYEPNELALFNKAAELMIRDPKLFQFWLNNVVIFGEVKAGNMLIKEAISLSKNNLYNPCKNE